MRLSKRLLKSRAGQGLLARVAAAYVRLVTLCTRWRIEDAELKPLLAAGEVGILAFWHGRLLMMPMSWKGRPRPFHMMISEHRDGALIARAIARLDLQTVAADSKSGARAALRAMKRHMDAGGWVGITPDGPKGPRMRAKPGAIKLAQLSGRPIVPVSLGMSRRRIVSSWDRFLLAWPFGRGVIRFGAPIRVPRDADAATLEAARRQLEDSLNALTEEVDRRCGVPAVAPAPEPATPDDAPAQPLSSTQAAAGRV